MKGNIICANYRILKLFICLATLLLITLIPIYSFAETSDTEDVLNYITPGQQITTSINFSGDTEWYAITVDHTCSIVSQLTSNNGYINYYVYDAALNSIYSKYYSGSATYSTKVKPGLYYIKLSEFTSVNYTTNSIAMTVSLRAEDAFENNDNANNAHEVTSGQPLNGIAIEAEDDEDWFKINVTQNSSIVSQLSSNSGSIRYTLCDSSLNTLYTNCYTGSATYSTKVKPGLYYIKLSQQLNVNYVTNNNTMTVSLRAEDTFENNDNANNAFEVISGQQLTGIAMEAENDEDWFKINVTQTSSIVSQLSSNNGSLRYTLYDASFNSLYTNCYTGSATYSTKVKPGLYYIKLSQQSFVNYATNINTMTVSLRAEDAFENNDSANNAYELTSGQQLSGIAIEAENDEDWFKINVTQTSSIVSQLNSNSGYIKYTLYDASLNIVYTNYYIGSATYSTKVKQGLYYIKLSQQLNVNYVVDIINLSISLVSENNTIPTPLQDVVLDQQITTGITYSGDVKWFKINVTQTSSVLSSITNNSGTINYAVYDESLNKLFGVDAISSSNTNSFKVSPGVYYIKLSEKSGINYSTSSITLKVNLRTEDSYENNDNALNAYEIMPDQQLTGIVIEASNDSDWFRINVGQRSSIISTITNNSGIVNYDIYDQSKNNLLGTTLYSSSNTNSFKVSPGVYYIKLSEKSGINYSTSNITLKVSLRAEDSYENNDNTWNAYEIAPGQQLTGIAIEASNDSDWFKINVGQRSSIISTITNNTGTINYALYNESLNKIYGADYISSSSKNSFKVGPGVYYIRLYEYNSINYSISNIAMTVSLRTEDSYENNDNMWNAYNITPGQQLTGIAIEASNDSDWFKINIDQTGYIVSEITNNSGSINYAVYDESMSCLYSKKYIGTTDKNSTNKLLPGVYYIRLYEYVSIDYSASNINLKTYFTQDYNEVIGLVDEDWCRNVGEPVNVVNGNFYTSYQDISIPTRSAPLEFKRSYNSCSNISTTLGNGWLSNYDSYLTFNQDNSIGVTYVDGHSACFMLSSGSYTAQSGCLETLVKNSDGTYKLTFINQLKYIYDPIGRLVEIIDNNNNTTTLQYSNLLLSTVTDPSGRSLTFTYNENNQLITITDPAGNTVEFTYDALGNLVTSKDLNGGITHYTYGTFGLTEILDPENHYVIKNVYDPQSRVIEQENGKGQKVTILYDTIHKKSIYKDANGNSTIYYYDDNYRVTKVEYPNGTTSTTTYDANYNAISQTDQNGNTTTYTYDSRGNVLTKTDPSPLNYVTTYTYDSFNNPLTITDPAGYVTSYTYDSRGNLISTTKQGNGITITTTCTYDQYGKLASITNANGKVTLFNYDQYGNLSSITDACNQTTSYTYDAIGRKLTKTDPLNNTWSYTYDGMGNLLTEEDPLENINTYTYDLNGKILTSADANGNITTYAYDENAKLISKTDALNHTWTLAYDANGNKINEIDPDNNITTYEYDGLNRLISITDALNHQESYTLDGNGNIISIQDKNGDITGYTYDVLNRLMVITDPNDGQTVFTYDALGNVLTETNPRNFVTSYVYDINSKVVQVTDSLNNTTSYTYDPVGNRLSLTNVKGKTWNCAYNDINQLISATDPLGGVVSYQYDSAGNRIGQTDQNNNTTTYSYDGNSRLLTATDALGNITSKGYDSNGNLVSMTDALGHTWTYTYDTLNRLIKTTDPSGSISQIAYDKLGKVSSKTDANGNTTTYIYNALSQCTSCVDAIGNVTTYAYDSVGNLIRMTDANGNVTSYEYDNLNHMIKTTDALGNIELLEYDEAGNVITRTKPDNTVISYTYDGNNRLINISYPDATEVVYSYDALGTRTSMTDSTGITNYTYTDLNQLESVEKDGSTISYDYDAAGNLLKITYPNGLQLDYTYNQVNAMESASDGSNTISIDYDANNNRVLETMPNGVNVNYDYDICGRLTNVEHLEGNTAIAKASYTYDSLGNRTSKTDEQGLIDIYSYNQLNQLSQVEYSGGSVSTYTYDAAGNRESMYGVNELDSLDEDATYEYDYENRLVHYADGTTFITYAYDGDGNLESKTVSGAAVGTYNYYYDYSTQLPRLLVEVSSSDGTLNYLYAGRLYSRIGTDEQIYFHQDGLGSILAITDENGIVENAYTYDVFGELRTKNETISNSILFTGELVDEAGNVYLRARLYDPTTGRFLTKDTFEGDINYPLSLNLYTYCENDPVNGIDPSGHENAKLAMMYTPTNQTEGISLQDICSGIIDFTQGVGASVLESITLNASSDIEVYYDRNNETIYLVGKTVGSAGMTVIGTISSTACVGGDIVAFPTGVGELITVPATAYCVGATAVSSANLHDNFKELITRAISNGGSNPDFKKPISGSGKEKATDVPSWAKGNKPFTYENGKEFATRLMNDKYGEGNWSTSSKEYSQIKKWGDRGFE